MAGGIQVICVSRDLGAGGEDVGRLVSDELGYRYVDEEIVTLAAAKLGVPVDLVADVEARRSLTRRMVDEILADVAHLSGFAGVAPPPRDVRPSADYRALIEQTIRETADQGSVVIVAHAASVALGARPGVLRVLVTASPETRAERLRAGEEGAADDAEKRVHESDLAREDYLRRFYGVKRELPIYYDLVVNTDVLGADMAARLVLAACSLSVPANAPD